MNAPLRNPLTQAHPIASLFAEHGNFVYRTLRYQGVDASAIDDLLQDVFVAAHRRWDSFEGRSTPRTWLYGIARRVAFRHRRKRDNWRRLVVFDETPPEGAHAPFERAHAQRTVLQLLEVLDEDKRAAFLLCEVEEFTAAEAAAALGVPLGTVYSRVRAAWQRLRKEATIDEAQVCDTLAQPQLPPSRRRMIAQGLLAICPPKVPALVIGTAWIWAAAGATVLSLGGAAWASRTSQSPAPAAIEVSAKERGGTAPAPRSTNAASSVPPTDSQPLDSQPLDSQPLDSQPLVQAVSVAPRPKPERSSEPRVVSTPAQLEGPDEASLVPTLPAELALLRTAREAQRAGDPAAARRALQQHARQFPNGQLRSEREEALLQLKRANP